MAKFLAVFLSSIQYAFGIYIFRKPILEATGPFLASLIVLFSIFLLLQDIRLHPISFQKLSGVITPFEYFAATFITELLMGDCWFPLSSAIVVGFPHFANYLEDTLFSYNISCDYTCSIFRSSLTGVLCSYLLSFITLLGILHVTQVIDLCLLERGVTVFTDDVKMEIRKRFRKVNKTIEATKNKIHIPFKSYFGKDNENFYFVDEYSEDFLPIADHFYTG